MHWNHLNLKISKSFSCVYRDWYLKSFLKAMFVTEQHNSCPVVKRSWVQILLGTELLPLFSIYLRSPLNTGYQIISYKSGFHRKMLMQSNLLYMVYAKNVNLTLQRFWSMLATILSSTTTRSSTGEIVISVERSVKSFHLPLLDQLSFVLRVAIQPPK